MVSSPQRPRLVVYWRSENDFTSLLWPFLAQGHAVTTVPA